MEQWQDFTGVLNRLSALGVKLCMDDFGTGHSLLSYLHRFPLDMFNIDLAFIKNMHEQISYTDVTQAIVTLAHTLDIEVVAEGIEVPDQLAHLQALECDFPQG